MGKLCSICKKRMATIFYKQVVNGHPFEMNLCPECQKLLEEQSYNIFSAPEFEDLHEEEYYTRQVDKVVCKCGATKESILNSGKFGCSECYKTFADLVSQYINRLGGKTYSGKMPEHIVTKEAKSLTIEGQISALTEKMKQSAANDDFVNANKYKMKILELQKQLGKGE